MTRRNDSHPPADQRTLHRLRTRWAAIGAAVAVTVGAAGIGGLGIVSAEVSTGDRPVFVPITPCRLVDTRPAPLTTGVQAAPMGPTDTYVIQVRGNTDPCPATIPSDAVGLALNVTALRATQQSFLTFWGDGANPGTANLNPAPGEPPTPNSVNTPLGSNGSFQMYNDAGTVEVVIDVNGYYVNHNHDDRYVKLGDIPPASDVYTKAEIDATYAKIGNTYDRAQADGRFTQPGHVEAMVDTAVDEAKSKGFTAAMGDCNNDNTGPGDPSDGVFLSCAVVSAGLTGSHSVMIVADIGWDSLGGAAGGECRLERNSSEIAGTTVRMGEDVDTTNPAELGFAGVNTVAGPFTGPALYSVACRERDGDMDWSDITLSVLAIAA